MEKDEGRLNELWGMRNLTVDECIAAIAKHPGLKFLLTSVGIWYLLRWLIGVSVSIHLINSLWHLFRIVAG